MLASAMGAIDADDFQSVSEKCLWVQPDPAAKLLVGRRAKEFWVFRHGRS